MSPSGSSLLHAPLHIRLLGALAEAACAYLLALRARLRGRRNASRALFVMLCLGCTLAVGQGGAGSNGSSSQTPSSAKLSPAATMPAKISSKVTGKLAALRNNSKLQSIGKLVAAFFLTLLLVWTTVKSMASGKGIGELLGEWIPIWVSFGVVSLFLDRSAGNLIVDTMNEIGAAIGGQDMSTLESAIDAGTTPIFKGIAAVISQPSVSSQGNTGGNGGFLGWFGHLTLSAAAGLMGVGAKIVAVFLLVVSGVTMAAHIIMGFISVELVLALAPVMVPFLMFKPMEWMFSGWLKFLLGACMLKVVLAFLLTVAAGLLEGMSELAEQARKDAWQDSATNAFFADVLLLGMTVVFALIATLLVSQGPRIADGLLAGAAGGAGFSGIRGITHGAAAGAVQAAGRTIGSTASAMGAKGAQGIRNASSAIAGKRDGKAGKLPSLAYRDPRAKAAYAAAYRDNFKPPSTP